jgi:hypothetical protein
MKKLTSKCGNWSLYGNPAPKVLIAGHSHIFSMYHAITQNPKFQKNFGIVVQRNFSSHKQQGESYWEFVRSLAINLPTAISWNGNQHNIHFLVETDSKFNALGLMINSGYPVVPISHIREIFKPTFDELRTVLKNFPNNSYNCLLGTPAPKKKEFLNTKLQSDDYFVGSGKDLGIQKQDLTASSDELRAFMWNVTQLMTAEIAQEFNLKFLKSPESTYDVNMILKSNYYAGDLTHANNEFGVKMLEEILIFYGLSDE